MINRQNSINAYTKISLETTVENASPYQLIILLFDGALSAMKFAKLHMKNNDIAAKGMAISKAINIIDNGLRGSLNFEKGGEIADNLDNLYDYINRRLLYANLHNDEAAIDQCYQLLSDIANAWKQIGETTAAEVPVEANL